MITRTVLVRCDDVAEQWNPWRALREREHIEFTLKPLPAVTGGAVCWPQEGWTAIIIDRGLDRRHRNAALAHELVHDEHGGACPTAGMPPEYEVVAHRHEHRVRREVARRLVPLEDLAALIESHALNDLPAFTAIDVAEIFDVPVAVADEAIRLLQ